MAITLPSTMTHIEITRPGGPEVLEPRQAPVPRPAPGEVLVKIAAAGVNRPDVLQRLGRYPMPPDASPILGLEISGVIAALGEGVDDFAVGDGVCALTNGGGYAQYCVVPAGQVLPVPAGIDMRHAAAIPETFFTVWANLFMTARAKKGDCVLVHGGTSGIGTTALLLAREFGLRAFASVGSDAKCDIVRTLGAEPINYRTESFDDAVLAATGGAGVDIVLDIVGAPYYARNIRALAKDGRLILIGMMGGATVETVDLAQIMRRRITVTGSTMRARSAAEKAEIAADLRRRVWPALAAGRCMPLVTQSFPLAHAAEAHRAIEAAEHVGKIVLDVADS